MNNLHVIKLVQVRISGICVCECVYFFFLFIAFTEFVFTSSIKSDYFDIVWWYFGMQFLSYKCMSMTVWTGVNTLKPQTVIGRGLNDDWYCTHTHTPPAAVCSWLEICLPEKTAGHTHARIRGSAVCEIDQDAGQTSFTDELIVRLILLLLSYTHFVPPHGTQRRLECSTASLRKKKTQQNCILQRLTSRISYIMYNYINLIS